MPDTSTEPTARFDALFRAHSADIVAYCGWRSESASDAEDAVAEVFLIAWRRLDDVPHGDAGRVWLYATARRVMANQRRSRRRRLALHDRLARQTNPVVSDSWVDAEGALVHDALRRLGDRDREILLLAEWEGLTPAEIAVVLDCPTATARGRLHRARVRFRAAFEALQARARREEARRTVAEPRISPVNPVRQVRLARRRIT